MARRIWDLRANFCLVTPAFLAGASNEGPSDIAELRPPAFIGALRFWWRALAWSRTSGSDISARLATIRRWEAALFGAQASEGGGGQGAFLLKLTIDRPQQMVRRDQAAEGLRSPYKEEKKQAKNRYTHGYVALDRKRTEGPDYNNSDWATVGYATGVWVDNIRTSSLNPGITFSLHFRCFKDPGQAVAGNAPTLMAAVKLLGLVGAVGSRSRRGFGSLALQNLHLDGADVWSGPVNISDYRSALVELLTVPRTPAPPNGKSTQRAPYTAVDEQTRAYVADSHFMKVDEAHVDGLGAMRRWRSWNYQKGRQAKQPDTHHDHDWFYENAGLPHAVLPAQSNGTGAPRKTGFGLPLKFYKPTAHNAEILVSPLPLTGENGKAQFATDRRASPLVLHVHRIGQTFVPIWLYMPTVFLPGGQISVERWGKVGGRRDTVSLGAPGKRFPTERSVDEPYAATDAFVAHLAANGYSCVTGATNDSP